MSPNPEKQPATIADIAKAAKPKHRSGFQHEISNFWIREFNKFASKEVSVVDSIGAEWLGVCIAVSALHMNVLLRRGTEVIAIKNISRISRHERIPAPPVPSTKPPSPETGPTDSSTQHKGGSV